ncbi:3d649c92-c58a-486e-8c11-a89624eaf3d4 [Sclerotinia trifoliorum]|uniref:3d649c92-c58a-486e-8c11-a89624eaf3d4 n=1 Tax=Sclerotinia trifoliorum TaxID=28548 RepID=A0A8H2VVD9_9HELO|nr:3d649c92-c58a-486e-8c11-a89624eaf3d4 [Sclerotinia trifoliorum]
MPTGPDETHQHESSAGAATEHVMKNSSSKTDSHASDHPIHDQGEVKADKVQFRHHEANPGPVIPESMPEQEGSKADRQAKAAALNKL